MNRHGPNDNPWRGAALTTGIGVDLVVCLWLGYWLGARIGEWLGGETGWMIAGVVLGLIAAAGSIYLMIKSFGGSNG